eukprot:COSAG02_NODE_50605_length_319_cov_1.150000_1_plen_41_part_10
MGSATVRHDFSKGDASNEVVMALERTSSKAVGLRGGDDSGA